MQVTRQVGPGTMTAAVLLVFLAVVLVVVEAVLAVTTVAQALTDWSRRVGQVLGLGVVALLVLAPGEAAAQPMASASLFDKAYRASEWGVFLGNAYDAIATQRCLGEQRCVELNGWLARHEQPAPFTALKSAGTVAQVWATRRLRRAGHPRLALVTNIALGVGFTALGIRNDHVRKGER